MCGLGFVIFINAQGLFFFKANAGSDTNNREEFLSLLSLLKFANLQNIRVKIVMGDSLLVIKWMRKEAQVHNRNLLAFSQQTLDISNSLIQVEYHHIYCEHNCKEDAMTKEGIQLLVGSYQVISHMNVGETPIAGQLNEMIMFYFYVFWIGLVLREDSFCDTPYVISWGHPGI